MRRSACDSHVDRARLLLKGVPSARHGAIMNLRSGRAFFGISRLAALAGVAAMVALAAGACSSSSAGALNTTPSPSGGAEAGGVVGFSGGGMDGGGGAKTGDANSATEAGPTATCTPADLLVQTQCGAGLACDVNRSASAGSSDGGTPEAGGPEGDGGDGGKVEGGGGGGGGGGDGGGGGLGDGGAVGDGGGGGPGIGSEAVDCRAATATGTEGVACNAADPTTCASGLTCVALDATSAVCQKFCGSDSTCDTPGGACRSTTLDVAGTLKAKTCSLNCNPLTAMGCGTGQNCDLAISADRLRLYTDCIAAGAGGYQQPCAKAEDCKQGYSCLKLEQGGQIVAQVCLQACTITPTPSTCASGTCTAISPPNTLAGTQYGWCY
jgi:hypothetical protein